MLDTSSKKMLAYVSDKWRARNRFGVTLAGVLAVLFIILAITVVNLLRPTVPPPNGAERLATSFYTALEQQNYQQAYTMLADQQQLELTPYTFTLFARAQTQKYGPVTAFHEVRYDRDTNHANQGVVRERITRGNHTQYLIGLTMVQSPDGTWKILEEDHAI